MAEEEVPGESERKNFISANDLSQEPLKKEGSLIQVVGRKRSIRRDGGKARKGVI